MVQGTNFPPILQRKGAKKNHAFSEHPDNQNVKNQFCSVISNRNSNQAANAGNNPYKKHSDCLVLWFCLEILTLLTCVFCLILFDAIMK